MKKRGFAAGKSSSLKLVYKLVRKFGVKNPTTLCENILIIFL